MRNLFFTKRLKLQWYNVKLPDQIFFSHIPSEPYKYQSPSISSALLILELYWSERNQVTTGAFEHKLEIFTLTEQPWSTKHSPSSIHGHSTAEVNLPHLAWIAWLLNYHSKIYMCTKQGDSCGQFLSTASCFNGVCILPCLLWIIMNNKEWWNNKQTPGLAFLLPLFLVLKNSLFGSSNLSRQCFHAFTNSSNPPHFQSHGVDPGTRVHRSIHCRDGLAYYTLIP